jgi:hypothetical protein
VSSGSHRIGTLNPTLLTASIPHFLSVWPWLVCPGRSRRSRSRCGSQGQTRGSHHRGLRNLDRIRTGLPGLGNGVKWQHFMMLSTSSASDRCESQGRCGLTGAVRSIEPTRLSSLCAPAGLKAPSLLRSSSHSIRCSIRTFFLLLSLTTPPLRVACSGPRLFSRCSFAAHSSLTPIFSFSRSARNRQHRPGCFSPLWRATAFCLGYNC